MYARGYFLTLFRSRRATFKIIDYLGAKFLVDLNQDVGWLMHSFRNFEDDEVRILGRKIQPDWTCLDVGGNIGFYSVMLGKLAPRGLVISCEPVSRNVSMIAINRILNDLSGETLVTLIGDVETEVDFAEPRDSSYASVRDSGRGGPVAHVVRIPMTTIDALCERTGRRFDFIKIDIEGAEEMAVRGMRSLLTSSRRPRLLMLEICDENLRNFNSTGEALVRQMEELGYYPSSIINGKEVSGYVKVGTSQNVFFKPAPGKA